MGTLNLKITTPDAEVFIVSGDRLQTAGNLQRLFKSLAAGSRLAASTVQTQETLVAATGTITPATVTVGQTVSINGTALTAQQANARATATLVSAVAGNTITVNGTTFTAQSSAATPGTGQWDIRTGDTEAATSLKAQINAHPDLAGIVTATSAAGVVTIRAVTAGTAGNSLTLTKSGSPITVTGSGFLAGGAAYANNKFDFGGSDLQTGTDLARAINASSTALVSSQVSAAADASTGVVTLTALFGGITGNAVALASSDGTTLAVTGARLTGGSAAAAATFSF